MKYKAICFDIDGTLYGTNLQDAYIARLAFLHPVMCAKYNALRKYIRSKQDTFENGELKDKTFREREAQMFIESSGCKKTREEARAYLDKRYYKPLFRQYKKIGKQPLVIQTMHYLKYKGIRVAALSDWPIENKLKQIGVEDFMEFKVSSDEIGYLKPDIHCFEYILNTLNLKSSEVLYVGDSYVKDVQGPKKAGIDAVLINCNERDAKTKYPEAVKICKDWAEFDVWLKEQEN